MPSPRDPETVDRILVVDDEPAIRRLFARTLRKAGYDVTETATGDEALGLLEQSRFRLLLLDLDMPDTDGFDVLRAVRQDHPGLSVIVISGYMDGALLNAAQCLGATTAIPKANATQELVSTVRSLLGAPSPQK